MSIDWNLYPCQAFYDEPVAAPGKGRDAFAGFLDDLSALGPDELAARQEAADLAIKEWASPSPSTSEEEGTSTGPGPSTSSPGSFRKTEWDRVEAGLKQRVRALNLFIDDVYHDQRIIKDGVFPAELLAESVNFRPQCVGVPHRSASGPTSAAPTWCATPTVRSTCWRTTCGSPPGVSYMLENRLVTKRVFPEPVRALHSAAGRRLPLPAIRHAGGPVARARPTIPGVVVLTPGHLQLRLLRARLPGPADGLELVEGRDLVVATDDGSTCARSTDSRRST